jgi:hypothetical protein
MLQILIIFGWLMAFGCLLYLAAESLKIRFSWFRRNRAAGSKTRLFKTIDPFARKRERPAQNIEVEIPPAPHEARGNFPRGIRPLGYVLLIVWEGYWISEVAERFAQSANPLQLPYFFLIFVMVGVPLAAYLVTRRLLRRSVQSL